MDELFVVQSLINQNLTQVEHQVTAADPQAMIETKYHHMADHLSQMSLYISIYISETGDVGIDRIGPSDKYVSNNDCNIKGLVNS